jgi:prepilin-type N-terminal cleavage/methylation domain-containing protein
MYSKPKRGNRRRAFSLVELMVVIVIIGLLSGVVTVSVRSYLVRGKQTVARMEIAKIAQAIDTFYSGCLGHSETVWRVSGLLVALDCSSNARATARRRRHWSIRGF